MAANAEVLRLRYNFFLPSDGWIVAVVTLRTLLVSYDWTPIRPDLKNKRRLFQSDNVQLNILFA